MSHRRIGEILLADGVLSAKEFHFALMQKGVSGRNERTGAFLIEQGFVGRVALAQALARQAGWPFFSGAYIPESAAVERLGLVFLQEHRVYPLKSDGQASFVMPDGDNTKATDALYAGFGRDICFYIGVEADLVSAINGLAHLDISASGPADIRQLLNDAAQKEVTDIHIEPSSSGVNVRFRIDGVLHFHRAFPREELSRMVNVFFNKAGISAGDFMRFHDARFEEECGGHKMDIRLSHIPSVNGSSLVLRLLDKSRSATTLSALGYRPVHLGMIEAAVRRPHGLMLLTGPTGCGKTTSLYALLNGLKDLSLKVVTAEDPVEIKLPLVTQVMVDARKEHDFHHITRALLRHDPDIILIGEIRDEKTAREAVRAAVTGHRVLATLHSNDVVSAILRLKDLGMDFTQISHTLTCVVAQRLVRVLCSHCRGHFSCNDPGGSLCSMCHEGYKGRTVAAEVMLLTDEMRFLIEQGLIQEMSALYLRSPGRLSMRQDAEMLVGEGRTSGSELERVLG